MDLGAITAEILGNSSAVAEVKHDVAKIAGVREAEGVAEFGKAGEIDDGVAQKIVCSGATRDIRPQRFHVGPNIDNRSLPAVHKQRLRLPVFPAARFGPMQTNQRSRFACRLESKSFSGVSLPRLEGPKREFAVSRTITRAPVSFGNEVGDRLLRFQSLRDAGLAGPGSRRAQRKNQETKHGRDTRRSQRIALRHHLPSWVVCTKCSKALACVACNLQTPICNSCARLTSRRSSRITRAGCPSAPRWWKTARSLPPGIIAGCKSVIRSRTGRWIASAKPAAAPVTMA